MEKGFKPKGWERDHASLMEESIIKEIVEYERYCCDYHLKEQQRELWFEDGVIFTTWFKGKFIDYQQASPVRVRNVDNSDVQRPMTNHRINNTVVWTRQKRAIAELLCFLDFRTKLAEEWVDIQCWCRMHYRLEKRKERWGIVYMEGIYEKDQMQNIFMDHDFCITEEKLRHYRPNNWNMAVRRDIFEGGLEFYEDWSGSDHMENLYKLYQESIKWLEMDF